jgi:beta-N-acetylhexosaminidase
MSTIQEDSVEHDPMAGADKSATLPTPAPSRRKRGPRFLWRVIFGALVLLVILGGSAANTLFMQKPGASITPLPSGSAFVTLPLSPAQIYRLQHMPEGMRAKQLAQLYVSQMSLDEKLGQLFMVQAETWNDSANTPDTMYMLNQLHAGGIIMYTIQMNSFNQTKGDIQNMQLHASIPLLVSADEEGGEVERVQKIFGDRPSAMDTYRTGNVNNAVKLANGVAHDLQAVGINTDLAPDVDVLQANNASSYMDTRTFGYTPQSVITYGGAYLRAIQGNGEVAALKHYPGLGAATTDAHTSLPVINSSKDKIYSTDLAPYQYFLSSSDPLNNPGMIMTTDLMMPALDPTLPAELSPAIINGILRNQYHYDGVVITDALWMDGIAKKWNLVQASMMSLNAGDDMLLGAIGSAQMEMVLNGLKNALQDGQLSMARVDQAVTRIIALKFQYHILRTPWY